MQNLDKRDKYENIGWEYVQRLFNEINEHYKNTTIDNMTKSEDPCTTYDMTATINGKVHYIENKSRSKKYTYEQLKDKGFYLRARKNNGQNTLFAYVFPTEQIVMLTRPEQLEGLEPEPTKVNHKFSVDEDSEEDIQYNYNVPLNKWWVYQIEPFKVISTPNNVKTK